MARHSQKKGTNEYEFSISDFQQADERALKFIVIGHWRELVSFAKFYLSEQEEAEDAVSEIFSVVWQKRFDFADYISLRKFMFVAIKNRAIDKSESLKRQSSYLKAYTNESKNTDLDLVPVEVAEMALASTLQNMVTLVNDLLPPKTREVVMLGLGGLKDKEIAQKLAIARQNVSKYRQNAVIILRKHLPKRDLTLL